ncbi:MAG: ribonuclease H-like domain-containing protein [Clostridiaceae bacterium]
MIIREKVIKLEKIDLAKVLEIGDKKDIYKDAIYLDLEHYIYKFPICIGVFGCCYFDEKSNSVIVTQYMIENRKDAKEILKLTKKYFDKMYKKLNKKYIVTFSGNNDFTVIKYLFKKYKMGLDIDEIFTSIDLQEEYKKVKGEIIGLKNLEGKFNIERESEVISGGNLAKTFSKIMKDDLYFKRMPKEKIEKILLYNEQDVVSLIEMNLIWQEIL